MNPLPAVRATVFRHERRPEDAWSNELEATIAPLDCRPSVLDHSGLRKKTLKDRELG